MLVFHTPKTLSCGQQYVSDVILWLYDTGSTYFDYLFGSPGQARQRLASWLMRSSSQFSLLRTCLLLEGNRPVGGFVGLTGADLARCQKADTLALWNETPQEERPHLRSRMEKIVTYFPNVKPDDYYLRAMGLIPEFRGKGLGKVLLAEFLSRGSSAGFRRFRLEVAADNIPAIKLYRRFGFQLLTETTCPGIDWKQLSMFLEVDHPT